MFLLKFGKFREPHRGSVERLIKIYCDAMLIDVAEGDNHFGSTLVYCLISRTTMAVFTNQQNKDHGIPWISSMSEYPSIFQQDVH